ncbi:MAG: Gfo/Idh/MocA family protein [Planctomycetota bacterium]|jgi:predicted dehydrogenase
MAVDVGVIGAGGVAHKHLANLGRIDDVTVRAVSDIDLGRAEEAAAPWGAKAYAKCVQMVESEAFDAVFVCLPPGMHGSLEIELADLGLPFYIEKPPHLDLMVAAQVESMVREKNLLTSVGYQLRYSDAVAAAREHLTDRQLALAQGFYITGMPATPWWRQKGLSGGQVVEQSTHLYDLLRYLAGEVETVYAIASNGGMTDIQGYDVEDASVANLEFSNGTVGYVVSSCVLTEGGDAQVGLRFDGRDFTLKLATDSLELADGSRRECLPFPAPPGGWMGLADRAFIEAVRSGDRSAIRSDYSDALRTLALTLAVNKSMETGGPASPSELLMSASHGCP